MFLKFPYQILHTVDQRYEIIFYFHMINFSHNAVITKVKQLMLKGDVLLITYLYRCNSLTTGRTLWSIRSETKIKNLIIIIKINSISIESYKR
jgi:hypothetical protein